MTTPETPLALVRLRNGTTEAEVAVRVMASTLVAALNAGDAMLVYELVMLCRDPRHRPWGNVGEKLVARAWAAGDDAQGYSVHETVRNVVLSMAEGDGLDMTFRSPVAD